MEKTHKTTTTRRKSAMGYYERQKAERGDEFLAERARRRKELRAVHKDLGIPPPAKYKPLTKHRILRKVRIRARKAGMVATIRPEDLHWPTHCPVLGLELDYSTPRGLRDVMGDKNSRPSIDRWDNSKGYVPGNCFVISYRANVIKNNATAEELQAVANYAILGPLDR